jgi:multiple sugar transport system permease protein
LPESGGEPLTHLLMAASVMTTAPLVILFFSAQRYFVQGIALTGLKG